VPPLQKVHHQAELSSEIRINPVIIFVMIALKRHICEPKFVNNQGAKYQVKKPVNDWENTAPQIKINDQQARRQNKLTVFQANTITPFSAY
jgi:hypothetical protein